MKPHLFNFPKPIRFSVGEQDYIDYQEGDETYYLGNIYGESYKLFTGDIDKLIEVLQEIKILKEEIKDGK